MTIKMHCFKPLMALVAMFLLIAYIAGPVYGQETPAAPSGEEKCGSCTPSPPSPPPPTPPPPPPALPPPTLPPPSPKKPPSTSYCPPPPSSFIYITGPPGQLYPIDQSFNDASRSLVTRLPILFGCGLLGLLLAFW